MSATQCRNHPMKEAAALCAGCQASLCVLCTTFDGFDRCAPCHAKFTKSRNLRRGIMAAVVLVGLGTGGFFLQRHLRGTMASASAQQRAFDYGEHAREIGLYRQRLADEPCDRNLIVKYGEKLLEAGDNRGAITVVDEFISRCGQYERLLWVKFSALKQVSEFKAAGEVAGQLIELDPNDHDYWWWRGEVMELSGDLEQAAADYRQAIATTPRLRNIPMNLAKLYERMDMPCEALVTLENYLQYYPEVLSNSTFAARLEKLRTHPQCAVPTSKGFASIRYDTLSAGYVTTVSINGVEGQFVIDTGASAVTVRQEFAVKAGLSLKGQQVKVKTANGTTSMHVTAANEVSLKGLQATAVPTLIGTNLTEEGIDGLLGMSFLSRFDVQVDSARRLMVIRPRKTSLAGR